MDLSRATTLAATYASSVTGPGVADVPVTLPVGFDLVCISAFSLTDAGNSIRLPIAGVIRSVANDADRTVTVDLIVAVPDSFSGVAGTVSLLIAPKE